MAVSSAGVCLSLSDLHLLVRSRVCPSMSLKMASYCSFLWLTNIPLCVWSTSFLFILCRWLLRLVLCLAYCQWCCCEHRRAGTFLGYGFLWIDAQELGLLDHVVILFSDLSSCLFFFLSGPYLQGMEVPWRGFKSAAAALLCQSPSKARSEPHL